MPLNLDSSQQHYDAQRKIIASRANTLRLVMTDLFNNKDVAQIEVVHGTILEIINTYLNPDHIKPYIKPRDTPIFMHIYYQNALDLSAFPGIIIKNLIHIKTIAPNKTTLNKAKKALQPLIDDHKIYVYFTPIDGNDIWYKNISFEDVHGTNKNEFQLLDFLNNPVVIQELIAHNFDPSQKATPYFYHLLQTSNLELSTNVERIIEVLKEETDPTQIMKSGAK